MFNKLKGVISKIFGKSSSKTTQPEKQIIKEKPKKAGLISKIFGRKKRAETSAPLPNVPKPEPPKETETEASIELQIILDMISDAQGGDFKPAAMTMIFESCERLSDIITEARGRLSDDEIMERLKSAYGGNLELLTFMIDSIIYAVYNKNDSGFAKWAGRGARARWESEISKIESSLR